MATAKKRKSEQEISASDDAPPSVLPFNPKPQRQTIYFPITDDSPPSIPPTNGSSLQIQSNRSASPESEPESESETEESISSLLEPLSREQLISLLRFAAANDSATLEEIRRVADLDPAHRKLFVHGLGWDANSDALRSAFVKYGEIDDCRVITEKGSGRSKGYGFVLFRHRSSAKQALRRPNKKVGNRVAICQLASSGGGSGTPTSNPNPNPNSGSAPPHHSDNFDRKIYVANVHANFNVDRLYNFFAQFGEIEEGPLGFDRQTGKPKGFALFVYKTSDGARKALEEPVKNFEGHVLNCQRASEGGRNKTQQSTSNPNPNPTSSNPNSTANPNSTPNPNPISTQAYDMSAYGTAGTGLVQPDLTSQNQMFNQSLLMGQPNAAFLAMLAAAMQNPAMLAAQNPAMLAAAMNPAFAAQAGQSYAGFQVPPGFQGPPGFQAGQASGSAAYQSGSGGTGQMPGQQPGSGY
ncbi:hypothetical protein LUZ60_003054 [Juncus effusus]|nr:hypothetical protein LUZ60_003054 [Juncus effusus]